MTTVKLRLNTELELTEFGVVANVYDISDRPQEKPVATKTAEEINDLVIPAGWASNAEGAFTEIDLDPGRYIIEAILPSGELVREELYIEESAEPVIIVLRSEESPHEWLGWQRFVGSVPRAGDAYERRLKTFAQKAAIEVKAEVVSTAMVPPAGQGALDFEEPDALSSRGFFFALPGLKEVDFVTPLEDLFRITSATPPPNVTDPLISYAWDEIYEVYYIDTGFLPGLAAGPDDWRCFVFIRGEGITPQYGVLPVPWPQVDHSGEATVEVLVSRATVDPTVSRGIDPGYRTSVNVRDRVVGSVISYLGAGDLPAAAAITNKARVMLFEKVANPLAAAAGAYALLSTERTDEPEEWHEWVSNLMEWFGWLPDGAILNAWVILGRREGADYLPEARACLLEGYRRGLPFYSQGVKLLLDGLTLFANDAKAEQKPDEEVEEALKVVRQLALRTNPRQPFTTVLLG
ncbi:MAG: hypothetical protein JSW52_00340 [Candidatus Coatesbacteria bacterium]|nr:MAG: hypothetical protein JSW52_00340 [Candidatus Coatesbacteria bacterium]